MIQSYFKIGWRNLLKHKMYSSIKIGGFAIGIAACLLIMLYIRHEISYDKHYVHGDRVYRILRSSTFRGESGTGVHFPAPFINVLKEEYPEIEVAGHYNANVNVGAGSNEVRPLDRPESSHEERLIFIDQGMLDILEVKFISGNPRKALTEPNTIVITRSKAEKYFPNGDALGKIIELNNDANAQYKITGVVEDFPATSHLQFDFMMTLVGKEFWPGEQTNWRNSNYIDYVRVRPGTNIESLEKKLQGALKKYFLPFAMENGNAEEIAWLNSFQFKLQPVHEIYLNDEIWDISKHGDIRYIWLFGAIATFILIIACINFINLSTAKSANRAKEVGLRKVVGSLRSGLIKQFLTESLLFSIFSFAIGAIIAYLLLPYFNMLVAKSLVFPWKTWWFIPLIMVSALIIGIIAGIYPSFYLSSFKPLQVLKGNISRGSKHAATRSALVVFQFTVSIILITGTVIIDRQMNYILTKKLGFNKDHVLVLEGTHTLGDNITPLKNELLRLAPVQRVSISGYLPVAGARRNNGGMWTEGMLESERVSSQHWAVDHDYIKTMGLHISNGRDFSTTLASDSQAMIINESMVKALNLEEPIGQRIFNWKGEWTVVGVIEDFHFESMKEHIQPMALFLGKNQNAISVKLKTKDIPSALTAISGVWKQFSPHQPIRFTFLDQRFTMMYDDIERTGKIFNSFALLAIIIACLGLFALSAFMVEQRTKEVSIRLVLGASVNSIFRLLTGNFVKLVLISMVIAIPIAWYLMQRWLQDFVYKISITWDVFLVTGVIAILTALLTISYQAARAAFINPAESLKSE